MRLRSSLLALGAFAAFELPLWLSTQSGHTAPMSIPPPVQQHTEHAATLPRVVEGSKTPEKIPDYLAYRHFIAAAAEPDNPSAEEISRREALLVGIGFSQHDLRSFISELRGVRQQLDTIAFQRAQLSQRSTTNSGAVLEL